MRKVYGQTITDPKAPERLRGLVMKVILDEKHLNFEIDIPDEPTPNELGYLKLITGEIVDKLRADTGVEISGGEAEIKPKPTDG